MSKKIEKLKEINIIIDNILCELETRIFIENEVNSTNKNKNSRLNSLCE